MRHGRRLSIAGVAGIAVSSLLPTPLAVLGGYSSSVTLLVGVATDVGLRGLMGKRADGTYPWWSYPLFASWHLTYRLIAARFHRSAEPGFTEVYPGWLVGGWPREGDWSAWPTVIDVTCELPRVGPHSHYLYVPAWDRMPPAPEALRAAVSFALAEHASGQPVLVHCAQGHGRSVTVLSAALVAAGLHETWREAFAHIQSRRPKARLSREQRDALDAWSA